MIYRKLEIEETFYDLVDAMKLFGCKNPAVDLLLTCLSCIEIKKNH